SSPVFGLTGCSVILIRCVLACASSPLPPRVNTHSCTPTCPPLRATATSNSSSTGRSGTGSTVPDRPPAPGSAHGAPQRSCPPGSPACHLHPPPRPDHPSSRRHSLITVTQLRLERR